MRSLMIFRGNWDGKNERVVVCSTKKRAQELLAASASHMRDMFSSPNKVVHESDAVVWASPETVFERPIDQAAWQPLKSN